MSQADEATVLNLYGQGWGINRVAQHVGIGAKAVVAVLDRNHVAKHPRGCPRARFNAYSQASKLSEQAREGLHADLRSGGRHAQLAKRYGISRERVRQIADRLGTKTGRELQYEARATRLRAQVEAEEVRVRVVLAAKAQEQEQLRMFLAKRWAENVTVADIATELGRKPGALAVKIVALRREFPHLFPHRHHFQSGAPAPQ